MGRKEQGMERNRKEVLANGWEKISGVYIPQ